MAAPAFDTAYFNEVCERPHKNQAIFFLNAFWEEHGEDAEHLWTVYELMKEMDREKNGSSIDEMQSHRLLERMKQTLSVLQFRAEFRKIDQNFDKRMSLVEYCCWHYSETVAELLSRPQGVNEELIRAQQALDELIAMKEARDARIADLTARSTAGGVRGITAKNELAQELAKDLTEFRRKLATAGYRVKQAKLLDCAECQGMLWWTEREIIEMEKYMPRGGVRPRN